MRIGIWIAAIGGILFIVSMIYIIWGAYIKYTKEKLTDKEKADSDKHLKLGIILAAIGIPLIIGGLVVRRKGY